MDLPFCNGVPGLSFGLGKGLRSSKPFEGEAILLETPVGEAICKPTRVNAVNNAMVLRPVLARIREAGLRLPHLEPLKLEVASLFKKCGTTSLGEKAVYKASVEIKQLAGFVKRRLTRKEVTKERARLKTICKNISNVVFVSI